MDENDLREKVGQIVFWQRYRSSTNFTLDMVINRWRDYYREETTKADWSIADRILPLVEEAESDDSRYERHLDGCPAIVTEDFCNCGLTTLRAKRKAAPDKFFQKQSLTYPEG